MITATVTQKGAMYVYEVREDGEIRKNAGRTSAHRYTHIHVQRWHGDPDNNKWAARYTKQPRKLGAKLEYGYIAEIVEIVEAPQ